MIHKRESGMSTNHAESLREKLTIRFIASTAPLKEPNFRIKLWMLTICFPRFGFGSNSGCSKSLVDYLYIFELAC